MNLSPIEKRTKLREIFFCERKELGKGIGQFLQMVKTN